MFRILLALHLLFAVFAIGPLVHAASTANRGIRTRNGAATANSARMLRIYGIASVVVVALGIGLMSVRRNVTFTSSHGLPRRYADYLPTGGSQRVADFGDTWIWLSLVLWVVSIAVVFALLVPGLKKASQSITSGGTTDALSARVAGGGGAVALIYTAIVFLMVYRPGG